MAKIQKVCRDEKNIHAGHRNRLLNLVINSGMENISDIQVMEFVLTYVFPRGDTNVLAHRLLDRYGNLAGVLDADPVDMQSVQGIGERASLLLTLMPAIFHRYTLCRIGKRELLSGMSEVYDFCEYLVRLEKEEQMHIVGLDAQFKLKGRRCLAKGTLNMVGIKHNDITKFLNSTMPIFVFFIHNHPGGTAKPSKQDIQATKNLIELFKNLDVRYIDHFIVGSDGIYSIKEMRFGREFIALE